MKISSSDRKDSDHVVLICGDRDWTDVGTILDEITMLVNLHGDNLVIVEGEQRGADIISREICEEFDIKFMPFPADWDKYHRAAGPIRNKQMLVEGKPHEVIGFHSDLTKSKGTANMFKQAEKYGIKPRLVS